VDFRMKKAVILCLLAVFLAAPVQAAQLGFGLSAKSDDVSIYLPIMLENFMIEPTVRWYEAEVSFGEFKFKAEEKEIGVGIFRIETLADSLQLYYGARLSYIDEVVRYIDIDGRLETDGYRIAPALGFQYFLLKQLALAGEAEWYYLKTDGKERFRLWEDRDVERKETGTNSRVLLRLFF
jgi:hypothetical protein